MTALDVAITILLFVGLCAWLAWRVAGQRYPAPLDYRDESLPEDGPFLPPLLGGCVLVVALVAAVLAWG